MHLALFRTVNLCANSVFCLAVTIQRRALEFLASKLAVIRLMAKAKPLVSNQSNSVVFFITVRKLALGFLGLFHFLGASVTQFLGLFLLERVNLNIDNAALLTHLSPEFTVVFAQIEPVLVFFGFLFAIGDTTLGLAVEAIPLAKGNSCNNSTMTALGNALETVEIGSWPHFARSDSETLATGVVFVRVVTVAADLDSRCIGFSITNTHTQPFTALDRILVFFASIITIHHIDCVVTASCETAFGHADVTEPFVVAHLCRLFVLVVTAYAYWLAAKFDTPLIVEVAFHAVPFFFVAIARVFLDQIHAFLRAIQQRLLPESMLDHLASLRPDLASITFAWKLLHLVFVLHLQRTLVTHGLATGRGSRRFIAIVRITPRKTVLAVVFILERGDFLVRA
jgi:hypothetical protein